MKIVLQVIKFLIIFIYGSFIGCFSNILIDRFIQNIENRENGKKTVKLYSNSFTYSCGCKRKGKALIPIWGYYLSKGRCSKCGEKINVRYMIVELLMSITFVMNIFVNKFNVTSFLYCFVIAALVILSVVDLKTYEIPIETNYFILLIGIIVSIVDYRNIVTHIIGFFAVSSILWLVIYISKGRAMGGGDLKLMATCGLLLGWKVIFVSFMVGCILGSIIHIIRMRVSKEDSVLAMGPYLSMGVFVGMLYGPTIINWYMSLY